MCRVVGGHRTDGGPGKWVFVGMRGAEGVNGLRYAEIACGCQYIVRYLDALQHLVVLKDLKILYNALEGLPSMFFDVLVFL